MSKLIYCDNCGKGYIHPHMNGKGKAPFWICNHCKESHSPGPFEKFFKGQVDSWADGIEKRTNEVIYTKLDPPGEIGVIEIDE